MAKKYKKRYYKKKSTNLNKVMRNYFKVKLDTIEKVIWTGNGIAFVVSGEATSRNLYTLLERTPDWGVWRTLFHSFKLTGLAVEISPNAPAQANGAVFSGAAALGLITSRDTINWNNVTESNFSFLLSTTQIQRKYKSFNGGLADWHGTDNAQELDGIFAVLSDGNLQNAICNFVVKFSFYVTFKNPN